MRNLVTTLALILASCAPCPQGYYRDLRPTRLMFDDEMCRDCANAPERCRDAGLDPRGGSR